MDPEEQTALAAEKAPAEKAEEVAVAADIAPVKEQEPIHFVCKNCGYHDVNGGPPSRCPACYFRHASEPVHQVPVKEEAKEQASAKEAELPKAQGEANAADPVEAEEKPNVVTDEKPADEKPADEAEDPQTVRIVEKIVIVERAPADPPVQDAGKAVEEQG